MTGIGGREEESGKMSKKNLNPKLENKTLFTVCCKSIEAWKMVRKTPHTSLPAPPG